ncbi:MAG TPA: hypothetical protein VJZ25_03725, partial [Gemmatimonadaceae bacterium]|nr:hypothetical protein [Gemmatimonadaceae bacterium]
GLTADGVLATRSGALNINLTSYRLRPLLLVPERFDAELFIPVLFRGTLAPFFRASDSPIAIACLRLFTFRPLPDLRVPFLRRRIALSTVFDAAGPYLRLREDFFVAILALLEWIEKPFSAGLAHVVPKNPSLHRVAGSLYVALP